VIERGGILAEIADYGRIDIHNEQPFSWPVVLRLPAWNLSFVWKASLGLCYIRHVDCAHLSFFSRSRFDGAVGVSLNSVS
jgi:hypothetical protein